ncbi:MAG: hypothetical protein KDC88_11000 [Ignavibacteriae bacterium]|nr:hypothetical protein [Ignavibacteriota bacterium]
MKKNFFMLLSILFLMTINQSFSQEYGKIFSKNEADKLFGVVYKSQNIKKDVLISALQNTSKVVMFKLENNFLTILGDEREVLFSSGSFTDKNQVFRLFSKSKVEELLRLGNDVNCFVEDRERVLTVTNGDYTLEVSVPCPPTCN